MRGQDRKNIGRPKAIWNVGGEANKTKRLGRGPIPTAMEMARALIKRVKENDAKGDRASTKDKAVCMAKVINEWREMADKWEIGVSGDGQG